MRVFLTALVTFTMFFLACEGKEGPMGPQGDPGENGSQGPPGPAYPVRSGFDYMLPSVENLDWSLRYGWHSTLAGTGDIRFSHAQIESQEYGVSMMSTTGQNLWSTGAHVFDVVTEIPQGTGITEDRIAAGGLSRVYVLQDSHGNYAKFSVLCLYADAQQVYIRVRCLYYNDIPPDFSLNKAVPE